MDIFQLLCNLAKGNSAVVTNSLSKKHVKYSALGTLGFTILIAQFASLSYGLIILFSYLFGLWTFSILFRGGALVPDLFFMLSSSAASKPSIKDTTVCQTCANIGCSRHQKLNGLRKIPWDASYIPVEIDEAVEECCQVIINKYISKWYHYISEDEGFASELRHVLRFAIASLNNRIKTVNVSKLLKESFVPVIASHLDNCLFCYHWSQNHQQPIQTAAASSISHRLHFASLNRSNEIKYLRSLSASLQPFLVQEYGEKCRSSSILLKDILSGLVLLPMMDALADPYFLNMLFVLMLDPSIKVFTPTSSESRPDTNVPVLQNFVSACSKKPSVSSAMDLELHEVIKNQDLLYAFMQYLKQEGAVHILQFCLDVDEFNQKILNPDLRKYELDSLHHDASNIYHRYLTPLSADSVCGLLHLSESSLHDMASLIMGPPENIVKMRTTVVLFRAYDKAYDLLQTSYCPAFCRSYQYYEVIVGGRNIIKRRPSPRRHHRRNNSDFGSGGSNKFNKMVGVLQSTTIDGHLDPNCFDTASIDDALSADFDQDDVSISSQIERDLSTWTVDVPRIELRSFGFVFIVEIKRNIPEGSSGDEFQESSWTIERKYNEFYVLLDKLNEFHGLQSIGIQLPNKPFLISNRSHDFLASQCQVFSTFLKQLVQTSSLISSDLLFTFLTCSLDYELALGEGMEKRLGRMFRSVPRKLHRERGQHLEPFVNSFLDSTAASKPRPCKLDWEEVPDELYGSSLSSLYGDNFGIYKSITKQTRVKSDQGNKADGIFDSVLYFVTKLYQIPPSRLQWLFILRTLVKKSCDTLSIWMIEQEIHKLISPPIVSQLINLLTDIILHSLPKLTESEIEEKRTESLRLLQDCLLPYLKWVASSNKEASEGIEMVHCFMQNPQLNKHLSYVLLDCCVEHLFPELKQ